MGILNSCGFIRLVEVVRKQFQRKSAAWCEIKAAHTETQGQKCGTYYKVVLFLFCEEKDKLFPSTEIAGIKKAARDLGSFKK